MEKAHASASSKLAAVQAIITSELLAAVRRAISAVFGNVVNGAVDTDALLWSTTDTVPHLVLHIGVRVGVSSKTGVVQFIRIRESFGSRVGF